MISSQQMNSSDQFKGITDFSVAPINNIKEAVKLSPGLSRFEKPRGALHLKTTHNYLL
jgi:hypothetical protein